MLPWQQAMEMAQEKLDSPIYTRVMERLRHALGWRFLPAQEAAGAFTMRDPRLLPSAPCAGDRTVKAIQKRTYHSLLKSSQGRYQVINNGKMNWGARQKESEKRQKNIWVQEEATTPLEQLANAWELAMSRRTSRQANEPRRKAKKNKNRKKGY